MPARADLSRTFCPLGRTAEVLGDRAVILILRELFFGGTRFDEILRGTGLGPQLVSARLKLLEQDQVITRQIEGPKSKRPSYHLTEKGRDLFSVLYAMRNWAEKWAYSADETGADYAMEYSHKHCGAAVGTSLTCPQCEEPLGFGSLRAKASPALTAERATKFRREA